jgi:uncharacterized protein (DUF4415 family)
MPPRLIAPTPEDDAAIDRALADADPDDVPELTEAWFREAGRARVEADGRIVVDRPVSVRVDPEVVRRFKAQGPDWEDRLNETLRRAVGL